MGKQFDELSKAMARRVSRGRVLRGMVGGAFAGTLALIIPGRALADTHGNSACAHFCTFVYGENTPEAEHCTAQAAQGTGPCYYYGPASPQCLGSSCPKGTFCTSISMNYGSGEHTCQPY